MLRSKWLGLLSLALARLGVCQTVNFAFESSTLTESDITQNPAVAFGNLNGSQALPPNRPQCKVQPEDSDWPSLEEWSALNASLGGALLKPTHAGAACYRSHERYNADQCKFLVEEANKGRFWINDPLSTYTQWTQGNTCNAELEPVGTCTQGGAPTYVVNATEVKHVQMAVNFARNKNIRLIIR
jgi:hypothetical protein